MNTFESAEPPLSRPLPVSPETESERQARGIEITRNYMWWSMGAGLVPYPIVDLLAVAAVQLRMMEDISALYGVKFSENRGKSILASLIGTLVANSIANGAVGTMLKFLPVVGTFLGALSMPAFAGASTYAVGKVFIMHMETGGNLLDFDPARMSHYFHQQFEEGKRMAEELQAKKAAPPEV